MKIKKGITVFLVLGLLVLGGGYVAYRGYKSVRQHRLIKEARDYLAQPNERKALLTLQRALQYNPKDVEACRLMAQLSEAARSPGALIWRSRVVELAPRSLDDRLALAQAAMMFRDYATATNALMEVDAAGKNTAAYHNIAGALASTIDQLDQAQAHFLEASRLEPTNPVPQLNLAVVRLHGSNVQAQADARVALKNISTTNSALRCQALRELAVDATRSRQTNAALAFSKDLVQQTNSTFNDRLLRLDVLKGSQNAEYKTALADFRREAGTNTQKIYELTMWQMSRTGPAETLAWLKSLPPNTQTNQAVALVFAECQTTLRDWPGLLAFLDPQYWGELDFLRRAFKTRALRGQDLSGAAKSEWELALKAANNQKQSLSMLLQLAAKWNWQTEAEEILWIIVNRYPEEKRAFAALSQALYAGGRTRPLMQLYSQQLKRSPSDLDLKNNLAMTALLLEANELKPHDLARETYQKAPTNASFASTYAFSLHLQEKDAEALKVMQTLKPKDLEDPSIAGYYGLILKATGNADKARTYLDWASKSRMLPEEKRLFDRAKAGA